MNDTQLNALLKSQGCDVLKPRTENSVNEPVRGLKLDGHTFKAKKQIKGVDWHSNLNHANDNIESFLTNKLKELRFSSEYYEHFLTDIEDFVNYGLEQKLITIEDERIFLNETTAALTRLRNQNRQVPMTPGLLLSDFTSAIAEVSEEIEIAINDIRNMLYMNGYKMDFTKMTDRWVIDKARRLKILSLGQDDYMAKLYDKKARIMAYYKGQADRFKAGQSELADAFAFALLWREVMHSQSKIAKREDDEALKNKIVDFQSKTGINPEYNEEIMKQLRLKTNKYQYSKLSSVLNLFPTGALQFLDFVENNRTTQFVKAPQNITGFFVHEEVTAEKIREMKAFEGKYILLKDSRVMQTGFQLATEDFSQEGYIRSTPRKKMEMENYPESYIQMVCEHQYVRGSKAFVSGYQIAKVVYVETKRQDGADFQGGIRLWIQEVKSITPEEILAIKAKKQ